MKAQIVGPLTLAQCLSLDGEPVWRIPGWLGRLAGFLGRQVAWQADRLGALGLPVVAVLDEPALGLAGGAGPGPSEVASALRRALEAGRLAGAAVGVHCCSPLPTTLLAGLDLDVLSFDANLAVEGDGFPGLARSVMDRGGRLAFGLAPTGPSPSTLESIRSRWLALATSIGDPSAVAARSLVTATCGLGISTEAETRDSFALARRLASSIATHRPGDEG